MTHELKHNVEGDAIVRICSLVTEVPVPAPGSEKRPCDECEKEVWFAVNQKFPPGMEMGAHPDFIFCGDCGVLYMARDGATIMNIGPEPIQIKSLADQLKEYLDEH